MHKIYIILLASLFIHTSTYASNTIDSIGVENYKGKKVIIYQVEAKETYYSISKKYNVNYKDVMEFNDSKLLQIGVTLKIPTSTPFTATGTTKTSPNNIIEHTVIAKDNLNMLAEKYGTTVNDIKKANNLSSINLRIGQVLKIPSSGEVAETPTEAAPSAVYKATTASTSDNTGTIEHTIKAKENLNLLAQKYNTTIDEIKRLNGLSSNNLQIGQVLKVPSANGEVTEAPAEKPVEQPAPKISKKAATEKPVANVTTPEPTNNEGSIEHVVVASETIYSIAKKYNSTTYQIKTANNLTSNDLTVGQKLIIKNAKPATTTAATEEEGTEEGTATMKNPALKLPASRYGLSQVEEKGTAVWIADPDLDPTKMLILHRTVPVGTIIKITNPMTNRSTFAKVVGKFTENETTKDVIIVITKAVADAVGALDKRFFCNISYGALENEQ